MNISHKSIFNNNFSKEKRQFYEKLGNRYYHAYQKYQKKFSNNNKDYKKKVINWLFSKDEETRMILCSIENKKYTKLINEAYNEYLKNPNVKMYINNDDEEEKTNLVYRNNIKTITLDHSYFSKQRQFLNEIMFYQSESPLNDYDKYSDYFTLSNMLKNQVTFTNFCNEFSNNNFLQNPIVPSPKEKNKIYNIYFELPYWLYENYNYYFNESNMISSSNTMYFSLPKFFLALFEQVISIRYIIYNETNNLQEIFSSIYLYELLERRNKITIYLAPKEKKFSFLFFKIDELIKNLYNDKKLEEFVLNHKREEEGFFCNDTLFNKDDDDDLQNLIIENNNFFSNFFRENNIKDFINFFMLIHIQKLFTYDDFYFRGIFEKIYESYLNQNYKDLIVIEKKSKKRRKKKKNNLNSELSDKNDININNNEKKLIQINNEKNNDILKKKEKINNNIDFGEQILNILSESNDSTNNNSINMNVLECNKDLNEINNKIIEKNNINNILDININNIDIKNEKNDEEKILIYEYIKNLIYEYLFKQIENKEEDISIKNGKKKNKQKGFFLYDTTKINKKKKKNIIDNKNNNKDNKDKDNKDNNNIHKNENNEKKEKNLNISENKEKSQNNILINNDKNNNISNNNINKFQIYHINSNTFSSSDNNEDNKQNNFINLSQENNITIKDNITISCLNNLNKSIQDYYDDLEETLKIQRKIKDEITKYFTSIIKILFPNSQLLIYGSSLYNLDIDTSDLDISIITESEMSLSNLEEYLLEHNENNQFCKINAILSASVPIIKLEIDYLKMNNNEIKDLYDILINTKYYKTFYKYNNENTKDNYMNIINIDISLNSSNNKQLEFIKQAIKEYPEIKPLIKIIKKILQLKQMNNSYKGGMSSYCLFLLLYSYIKFCYNKKNENLDEKIDYGSLFLGFLFYYIACIDFNCTIIAPHLVNPFIIKYGLETIPTIIEPISKNNAGKTIFKIFDVINIFYQIYKDISYIMKKDNNNKNLIYELIQKYSDN